MHTEILIDGSAGEGGGQVLRSSLALSMITGRPVRIFNVRGRRSRPGLARQHLTALQAAAQISQARTSGAELGSREITFAPDQIIAGHYDIDIGTAGSTALVFQTLLPALLTIENRTTLRLTGGTHNPMAPNFNFIKEAFLPLVNRLGPEVRVELVKHGFYPAGQGCFTATITPAELKGFDLIERGQKISFRSHTVVANLPLDIAERESNEVRRKMNWNSDASTATEVVAAGPGNYCMIELRFEHVVEICSELGRIGLPAEKVAAKVARSAKHYLKSSAPLGEYLTDQWLLPLALAVWKSNRSHVFKSLPLSLHSQTHLDIISKFLPIDWSVDADDDDEQSVQVQLRPNQSVTEKSVTNESVPESIEQKHAQESPCFIRRLA